MILSFSKGMQLILIFTFSISLTSCCDEHCKAACDSQKSSLDCYKLCECDSLLLVEQNIQTLLSTSNLQNKAIDNFQDKTINTWFAAVITFSNCVNWFYVFGTWCITAASTLNKLGVLSVDESQTSLDR